MRPKFVASAMKGVYIGAVKGAWKKRFYNLRLYMNNANYEYTTILALHIFGQTKTDHTVWKRHFTKKAMSLIFASLKYGWYENTYHEEEIAFRI